MQIDPIERVTWPQSERRRCQDHTHIASDMARRHEWRIQPAPEPLWVVLAYYLLVLLLSAGFVAWVFVYAGVL